MHLLGKSICDVLHLFFLKKGFRHALFVTAIVAGRKGALAQGCTEATEVCTVPGDTLTNSKSSTIILTGQTKSLEETSSGRLQRDGALCTLVVLQLKCLCHLPDGSWTDMSWSGFLQLDVSNTFKHLAAEFLRLKP